MKLKEIDRNGNIAWSPKLLGNSYLAVGTATQQLDSNFSSKAQLEIFQYIPNEKGFDMPVVASVTSESKFSKLLWDNVLDNYGLIVGGFETGALVIYDCKRLLEENSSGEGLSQICIKREHKGPVHAMDFNKFKVNLLATGGSESDIFIWDLNKFDDPMTPGNKSQPYEEIHSLSWNHKVQHILGSTSTHRCQIWDLRKSDPVIKLSDTQMKMKCKKLVWHPEISTRLCISSEDDHTPIIQLWDLRYIQCPFHTLQRHTKGIVDLEWCIDDPDILMSVGRDRQMICWNMSSHNNSSNTNSPSEVIYECQLDQELINEAYFIPKHPGLVSISSFDCHISLYSLMGGRGHVPRELSDTVIDSFPLELYEEDNEIERMKREAEKAAELQLVPSPCLSKAPKWLKRPCGATFSFGGKLVQFYKFESSRSRNNSVSQNGPLSSNENMYKIFISQVSIQQNVVQASVDLDNAIHGTDSLLDYCQNKIDSISSQICETENKKYKSECKFELDIWRFIECHFFEDSRSAFLQTLGYSYQNNKNLDEPQPIENLVNKEYDITSDEFGYFKNEQIHLPNNDLRLLPLSEGLEKSLAIALMTGDIDSAIDICLHENRSGEAAILAVSSGRQDLFEKVQKKIFENSNYETTHLISIAVKRNWHELVNKSHLDHWKEVLAWLLTYVSTEELSELSEVLGKRLEDQGKLENNDSFYLSASICYICSGSINNFVRCWLKYNSFKSTKDLQRLIEIVVLLCKAVGDDDFTLINKGSVEIFRRYALILISHGNLSTALKYLGGNNENEIVMLRHRICESLRNKLPHGIKAPNFPFKITPILNLVSTQKSKVTLNAPKASFTDGMKLRNEMVGNCPNYQEKPLHFINNQMQFPSKMLPSDMQSNYFPNQLNKNPIVTPSSFSNNISQNNFPSQPMNQLPFLPNIMSGNPLTSTPTTYAFPNNQAMKSAWNDPPLLSENYRHETTKEETKVQPNFFNPTTSVTDIADLPNLGIKMNTLTSNTFNSFGGDATSDQLVPNKLELSNSATFSYKSHEKPDILSPEYEHTQKVLINLIEKCRQKDKSRQTKVKMDDIEKKITNLFDLIKTQPMSPELTNGFKILITTLESNNYRQSLDEVNRVIQTVNFSEAGLYLPSVKMLIQCSIKILE